METYDEFFELVNWLFKIIQWLLVQMSIPPSLRIVDVIPIYDHQLVHLFWGLRFLLACPELLLGNPLHLKFSPQFLKFSLQLLKISLQHLKISLQPPAHEVLPLEKLFFSVFDDRLLLLCLFSEVITATIFLIKVVKICSMLQILMIFWLYTLQWLIHCQCSPYPFSDLEELLVYFTVARWQALH